ncbi:ABC transporter substrate-binding protein [Balneatrix alpica]|uniref:ABC transporter substrate-binding protein n=1 Tax=Balneatrix alpica TaxID=75684 RepID=A0ABV5ZCC2_9GAMM|nr:ABC transporter substrate-binding protein [Balneatrix alpica]
MKLIKTLGLAALATFSLSAVAKDVHVAITQIVEHPALDSVRQGVQDELAERGYKEGENLKWSYESAQGAPATAAQIAKKFAGDRPDVIVAITTPSAQTMVASARDIPVVFSAVTDPVGAKLVEALDKPSAYVTGTTDMSPIDKHMELIKQIAPNATNLGIIYNPGEANAASLAAIIKQEAPKQGLTVVEAAAPKSADVQTAARSLVGKVDVIYVPTDNTVVSALEGVIKVAEQADIPLISGDTDSVKRGTAASLGFNYYDLGRQTGVMVARILEGAKASDLPVETASKTELVVNPAAAERMGFTLPQALIDSAKEVVQ